MSFKLKAGQSPRKGLRRIVKKQIKAAQSELTVSRGKSRDESIHEARKAMKKVRAVLRLVRPHIDSATYRKANAALRDAARPLTQVRDARILIDVVDKLANQYRERV